MLTTINGVIHTAEGFKTARLFSIIPEMGAVSYLRKTAHAEVKIQSCNTLNLAYAITVTLLTNDEYCFFFLKYLSQSKLYTNSLRYQ